MQLKVGQDYIPPTAIVGHAGNLARNSYIKDDVTAFYTELQRTLGHLFNAHSKMSITPQLFCLNKRSWDYTNGLNVFSQQCHFQETRAPGKALYSFDLQADNGDNSVLSGLDTTRVRPIELVLRTANDQVNNGDFTLSSTMYIFLVHDILVSFKQGGMDAVGFG